MGCTDVVTAEDGQAAVDALHAAGGPDAFDVILMDLHMPKKVRIEKEGRRKTEGVGWLCLSVCGVIGVAGLL
jgi:CheY-like chemotaxis protein